MSKRWQKVEISYLKKHAGDKSLEELAERFHTEARTVAAKLKELRLAAKGGSEEARAALADYQSGLELFYAKKWGAAAEALERAAAAAAGELAARARQFAEEARQREGEGAPRDPWLHAVVEKNRGNYEEALALCRAKGRRDDPRFAYLAAAVRCLQGDVEGSAEDLKHAIELEPRSRVHARHDPDFDDLRRHEAHRALLAG